MRDQTDAELVAGVRHGSREAAGRLAGRYLRTCRATALSIVGEIQGAEDVCQDAFIYAIERIEDCRSPEKFGAWLLQIVRNRSRNFVRDRKGGRVVSIEATAMSSTEASPSLDAERAELRDRLLAALQELPQDRREVVLLHDLEGWTHREIAEWMKLPPGTVRSHLHHARRRLRELLHEATEREE